MMEARIPPGVANHSTMKRFNLSSLMQTLRRYAPMSRAELSRLTGIDKKCVSLFSDELIKRGFIEERGVRASPRGRPSIMLDFVAGRNYSLGLGVQGNRINGMLFELPNRVVKTVSRPLDFSMPREEVVLLLRRVADELIAKGEQIAGVGISFPGTVDLGRKLIHTAANLPCLNKFEFGGAFADWRLGPIRFEQSSRAAAMAEQWFGYGHAENTFAHVEVGAGASVVMVNNNCLYHGSESFVGELGHVVVHPDGRKCRCGNQGCLEAYLGAAAIEENLLAIGEDSGRVFARARKHAADAGGAGRSGSPSDAGVPNAPKRSKKNQQLSPGAWRVLRDAGVWLGRGLGPVVNLFNPGSVVVYGELMLHEDIVLPFALEELRKCCLPEKLAKVRVVGSKLEKADALGAAALAFPGWFEGSLENGG